ncbi:hydrogenase 3 maturation endopeptidase HyCI [Elusimicrobiota bacterium]
MIANKLKQLKPPYLFAGIGNVLKGDDGLGPEIIRKLRSEVSFSLIECGEVPENYLKQITNHKSGSIVFVDAVDMGKDPGEAELLDVNQLLQTGMFTHGMSLNMMIDYVKKETDADIYLLGVQPKAIDFGGDFSAEVSKAVDDVVSEIKKLDGKK